MIECPFKIIPALGVRPEFDSVAVSKSMALIHKANRAIHHSWSPLAKIDYPVPGV